MVAIYSKSQAQELAQKISTVPDEILEEVNERIVEAYSKDAKQTTVSCNNRMNEAQWLMLKRNIEQKGYKVTVNSDQRDGEWYTIEL